MVVRHCRSSPSPQTTPLDEFLSKPVPISIVWLGNRPQEHARRQSRSTLYARIANMDVLRMVFFTFSKVN